jgi:aspartate carbamoyltransferase catalytic subunit
MTSATTRRQSSNTPPRSASALASIAVPRGLLGLQGLSRERLIRLLSRTAELHRLGDSVPQSLRSKAVATLFFEDSTRTKTSFTIAARRLGADVVDLSAGSSSVNKGESLIDTARNVEAMGVHAMIVRGKQSGSAALIQSAVRVPIINAGDGRHEHPTQGLLDAYTIAVAHQRHDFNLSGLTVVIVGDIANSRVARSNIAALHTLGASTICVGPPGMAPASLASLGTTVSSDFDKVLPIANAVLMLRIQFERHGEGPAPTPSPGASPMSIASIREYRCGFALTAERARHLRRGAVVLHPGPINRGIELDADVADGPRSMILQQVAHGVLVRMAVLEESLQGQ